MELSKVRKMIDPIDIKFKWVKFNNAFGHKNQYKQHYLLKEDKAQAKKIYNQLIQAK